MKNGLAAGGIAVLALAGAGAWLLNHGSDGPAFTNVQSELPISVSGRETPAYSEFAIVSKSAAPITITRVVANDHENQYGCDLRDAMNGKSKDPMPPGTTDTTGDFTAAKLNEGEETDVTFYTLNNCGVHVVKLHIETDRGSQDFTFR